MSNATYLSYAVQKIGKEASLWEKLNIQDTAFTCSILYVID